MTDETIEVVECIYEGCGELHELGAVTFNGTKFWSCRHAPQTPMAIDSSLLRTRTVRLSPVTKWRREP